VLGHQQSLGHKFRKRPRVEVLEVLVTRNSRLLLALEFDTKSSQQDTRVWWQVLVEYNAIDTEVQCRIVINILNISMIFIKDEEITLET